MLFLRADLSIKRIILFSLYRLPNLNNCFNDSGKIPDGLLHNIAGSSPISNSSLRCRRKNRKPASTVQKRDISFYWICTKQCIPPLVSGSAPLCSAKRVLNRTRLLKEKRLKDNRRLDWCLS